MPLFCVCAIVPVFYSIFFLLLFIQFFSKSLGAHQNNNCERNMLRRKFYKRTCVTNSTKQTQKRIDEWNKKKMEMIELWCRINYKGWCDTICTMYDQFIYGTWTSAVCVLPHYVSSSSSFSRPARVFSDADSTATVRRLSFTYFISCFFFFRFSYCNYSCVSRSFSVTRVEICVELFRWYVERTGERRKDWKKQDRRTK